MHPNAHSSAKTWQQPKCPLTDEGIKKREREREREKERRKEREREREKERKKGRKKEERKKEKIHAPQCSLQQDRKSTRLNSSHTVISYAVFCLKKNSCIINKKFLYLFDNL